MIGPLCFVLGLFVGVWWGFTMLDRAAYLNVNATITYWHQKGLVEGAEHCARHFAEHHAVCCVGDDCAYCDGMKIDHAWCCDATHEQPPTGKGSDEHG